MLNLNEIEYQSLHSKMFNYIIKYIYNRYGQNYFMEPSGDILFYNEFLMRNESTRKLAHSSHNFIDWYLRTNDVTQFNVKTNQYTVLANFQNYYPSSEHCKGFCNNIEAVIRGT